MIFYSLATALSCNHCQDYTGWDACDRKNQVAQCGYLLTNDIHRNLYNMNPSLPLEPPYGNMNWQCYELEIRFTFPNESLDTMYERGCTYREADICTGWDMVALVHVNCSSSTSGVPDVNDGGVDEGSGTEDVIGGTGRVEQGIHGWVLAMFSIIFMVVQIYGV